MFCATNRRAIPLSIPNKTERQKKEINITQSNFDPFASSPPNDFLRKLTNRMSLYDNYYDFGETKSYNSRIKSLSLKKE